MTRREPEPGEFSVYQFFKDGTSECVRRNVCGEEAVTAAKHYTESVAVQLGLVERVIITDAGDYICFEWAARQGRGLPDP